MLVLKLFREKYRILFREKMKKILSIILGFSLLITPQAKPITNTSRHIITIATGLIAGGLGAYAYRTYKKNSCHKTSKKKITFGTVISAAIPAFIASLIVGTCLSYYSPAARIEKAETLLQYLQANVNALQNDELIAQHDNQAELYNAAERQFIATPWPISDAFNNLNNKRRRLIATEQQQNEINTLIMQARLDAENNQQIIEECNRIQQDAQEQHDQAVQIIPNVVTALQHMRNHNDFDNQTQASFNYRTQQIRNQTEQIRAHAARTNAAANQLKARVVASKENRKFWKDIYGHRRR